MILTIDQLKQTLSSCKQPALFLPALNQTFQKFDISTPQRIAYFLSQVGHESNSFNTLQENLNYSALQLKATWPKRFTGNTADDYAHQPERIANRVYANRNGNGDELSGDGWKYRGRGVLQIAGKLNYKIIGELLGLDLINNPDLLLSPLNAVLSAGAYWSINRLNLYTDKNDFTGLTKRINGGVLGLSERALIFNLAKTALKF